MIIKEAVDYKAYFRPLLDIAKEIYPEETTTNIETLIDRVITDVKKNIGNYNWNFYLFRLYRAQLATSMLANPQSPRDKLLKLVDIQNLPKKSFNKMKEEFEHFKGINYKPIQTYDPKRLPPDQVVADLTKMEEDYKESIVNDDQLIKPSEDDEEILDFGNGFVWVKLDRHYCSLEADAMGHCGNSEGDRDGRIISLRKKITINGEHYYQPFLTFIYNTRTKTFGEMKGRGNDKPAARYHPYIIKLLEQPWVEGFGSGGYLPENNFSMNDLLENERATLLKKNPNLSMYPGAYINTFSKKQFQLYPIEMVGKNDFWLDAATKKMMIQVDIENVVDRHILKFINDMDFYDDGLSLNDCLTQLNDLSKENIGHLYDKEFASLENFLPRDEFINYVWKNGIDEELIDEYNLEEELDLYEISNIYRYASQRAQEDEYYDNLKKAIANTAAVVEDATFDFYGFVENTTSKVIDNFIISDGLVVYASDKFYPDVEDVDIENFVDEVGDTYGVPSAKDVNQQFEELYGKPETKESVMYESAPPSTEAENWIKSNKEQFKKQYGKDWEQVLYATAWKNFGNKITEHADPRSYINPWIGRGFHIDVSEYTPVDSTEIGKQFDIEYKTFTGQILEPKTGAYQVNDKTFPDFNSAMKELISNVFKDKYVTENNISRIRHLAGIEHSTNEKADVAELYRSLTKIAEEVELTEKSLSRIKRMVDNHAAGIITAYRGDNTAAENKSRNRSLLAYLMSNGYSVTGVKGSYIENMGSEDEREVGERSFFVVNKNVEGDDDGQLQKDLIFLGGKFDQDSILSIPYGEPARLIGTSDRENAFPSKGETMMFNKMQLGDAEGEFFSRLGSRKFAFTEEVAYPKTINGIRAMKKLAESI